MPSQPIDTEIIEDVTDLSGSTVSLEILQAS